MRWTCGRCAETCRAGALTPVGKTMTAEEVAAQVLRDRPFYDNSGGEPLGRAKYEGLGLPPATPDTRAPAADPVHALARPARQKGIEVLPAPAREGRP